MKEKTRQRKNEAKANNIDNTNKKNIADWKEVNITEDFFTKIEAIEMEYKSSKCKFGPGVVTEKQAERGRRKLKLNTTAGVFSLETWRGCL